MVQWQGRYHFMAVGGMGMSALAKILAQRGISVSGCDVQPHFMTKADLSACGVTLFTGHDPKHLQDADLLSIPQLLNRTMRSLELLWMNTFLFCTAQRF